MVRAFHHFKLTPLAWTAMGSVVLLFAVIIWQMTAASRNLPPLIAGPGSEEIVVDPLYQQEMILLGLATTSASGVGNGTDPVGMIAPQVLAQLLGRYSSLVESGTFSEAAGAEAAAQIAPNVRALVTYTPHARADVQTTGDTSYDRMLVYRADLQEALKPLLSNTRAEYEIYGSYIATGDIEELAELRRVAKNYSDAADAAVKVTVPNDAAVTHLELVNALTHFAATLESLATHADDPIGSVALLRTYNDTELAVVTSFDKLAKYARSKLP